MFDCGSARSVSYYLEPIFILGLYSKDFLSFEVKGITDDGIDHPIDNIKNGLIPFLTQLYDDEIQIKCKLIQRGFRPSGDGKVQIYVKGIRRNLPGL